MTKPARRERGTGSAWHYSRAQHEALIAATVAKHGLARSRFMPEVRRALLEVDGVSAADWREWYDASHWSVVPDAFKIDRATRTITVYEVEVTSFVNGEKYDKLAHLFWSVDEWKWDVRLVRVDSVGAETEIGMFTAAITRGKARLGLPPVSGAFLAQLAENMGCRP